MRDIDSAVELPGETGQPTSAVVVCAHCGAETLPRDSDGRLTAEGREMLGDLVMSGLLDDAAWRVVDGSAAMRQLEK
jgi:hypothetical protein